MAASQPWLRSNQVRASRSRVPWRSSDWDWWPSVASADGSRTAELKREQAESLDERGTRSGFPFSICMAAQRGLERTGSAWTKGTGGNSHATIEPQLAADGGLALPGFASLAGIGTRLSK